MNATDVIGGTEATRKQAYSWIHTQGIGLSPLWKLVLDERIVARITNFMATEWRAYNERGAFVGSFTSLEAAKRAVLAPHGLVLDDVHTVISQ